MSPEEPADDNDLILDLSTCFLADRHETEALRKARSLELSTSQIVAILDAVSGWSDDQLRRRPILDGEPFVL